MNNNNFEWVDSLNIAITVTDIYNNIIYMNQKSKNTFTNASVGDDMSNCHSSSSNAIIEKLKSENISNTYTIEKNRTKKIIHQTPWYKDDKIAGLVEFSIEIPQEIPHKIRN